MRYFVYYRPQSDQVRPYIMAEVVRETGDDGRFREWSAAASLAGAHCEILTREELLDRPAGARALMAWETLDDRQFDLDTRRMVAVIEEEEAQARSARRHLRLVSDEPALPPEPPTENRQLQWLAARRRTLIMDSLRLRDDARVLIERSKALRPNGEKPKPMEGATP